MAVFYKLKSLVYLSLFSRRISSLFKVIQEREVKKVYV